MIYLDYAANSPVADEVMDAYFKASKKYIGNPNSKHTLGHISSNAIDDSTKHIKELLNLDNYKVIYTSGATESNNLAIKGICEKYNKGHIIISPLEHSSIIAPVNKLQSQGFDVDIVNLNEEGQIDLNNLKQLLNENTILVTIAAVDSEVGIVQPISKIASIIKEYPNCVFHTDASQAIGKVDIDFSNVDMLTLAPHKFNGFNGFGCLIVKDEIKLIPQINGGASTTIYRSGTPDVASIIALEKALELTLINKQNNDIYLERLNKYIIKKLSTIKNVVINSNQHSINSTINFSVLSKSSQEIVEKLNEKEIYVSSKSACSKNDSPSKVIMALTKDKDKAISSIRISISPKTTYEEIDKFIEELKNII
jgi:cysteine desulfurase